MGIPKDEDCNIQALNHYERTDCWLQEIAEAIIKETSKINKDVDRNPTIINKFAFFNYDDELMNNGYTQELLLEHLDDMLLSDDGGVRKFAQIIDSLTNVSFYGPLTEDIKLDNIPAFVMLLNQGYHLKSDPPGYKSQNY